MAFKPTEQSIFATGIDKTLATIDVYADTVADTLTAQTKTLASGVIKSNISLNSTDDEKKAAPISELLDAGIKDSEARKLLDINISPSVDTVALLKTLPDTPLSTVSDTMSSLSDKLGINNFISLPTSALSNYVGTALDLLKSNIFCAEGGLDGLFDFSISLSAMLNGLDGFDFCDPGFGLDISTVADTYKPYAATTLMSASTKLGLDGIAGQLATDHGDMVSDKVKTEAATDLLSNYKMSPTTTAAEYPAKSVALKQNLEKIDPNWLYKKRGNETVMNLYSGFHLSDDAKRILETDSSIQTASVLSEHYDLHPRDVYDDDRRFPLLSGSEYLATR